LTKDREVTTGATARPALADPVIGAGPGGKMRLAMQLILTPMILQLMER